ncbi:SCO2523 family variant P-loop protein [Cryptosporangium minutisporangium]|uniref:SCO2523 family variant P-loop protein n=1 Tax=Cryptosporangium minutisporangium TaxID=113569 RepID=A0ABP6TCD9_9ACTN
MLVFATSDKGGTGRSVTSANIAYRAALQGADACYLDFDFGSPTAGAIFQIHGLARGAQAGGLHSCLHETGATPLEVDVWNDSDREEIREARPRSAGELVLFPGDEGGGEFAATPAAIERCVRLLARLDEEFDLCLVDLSAGRSFATDIVLEATRAPELGSAIVRWLVFHRWTRQHIIAANGLVYGVGGILDNGVALGHEAKKLQNGLRFVRTAYVDPDSPSVRGLQPPQIAWLHNTDRQLADLASKQRLGQTARLGTVPLDPVLQWREQLILDEDVANRKVANLETTQAFASLAKKLLDTASWEGL